MWLGKGEKEKEERAVPPSDDNVINPSLAQQLRDSLRVGIRVEGDPLREGEEQRGYCEGEEREMHWGDGGGREGRLARWRECRVVGGRKRVVRSAGRLWEEREKGK